MMNNTSALEAGDVVEIAEGAKLPFGLTEGFQVRLVRLLDSARRLVERDGQEWILDASQIRPRAARRPASPCRGDDAPVRAVRPHVPSRRAMMPAMAWR
jgi:hypothetical protein